MSIKNNFLAGLLCGLAIVGGGMIAQNSFVVKKQGKEKKRSASAVKEECVMSIVTMLSQMPDVHILVGQIQNLLLEFMIQVHDGAWMNNATKDELEVDCLDYTRFVHHFDQMQAELLKCHEFLTRQKEKYSVKKVN